MLNSEPRIVQRITEFKFDDPAHFAVDMYDEVMLFSIASMVGSRGTDSDGKPIRASDGQPYPSDRLADPELRLLTQFMNAGGGLFATGDHGELGRFLCHAVPRARNMRLWQSTPGQNALDEVSTTGGVRNDTNRLGMSPGSQFNDQSDDVPQNIEPRLYQRSNGIFNFSFPHPLLCGPNGVIRIMPDHPHEGECIEPSDTGLQLNFGGPLGDEYPAATDGGVRPLPEVISTSTILSGTTSAIGATEKTPTVAHSFGGICAYEGHRAGVGRVVTDATWHHFVNVNLVGDNSIIDASDPKSLGFLATAPGQAHLEEIRAYYRNIAVWLAPPVSIRCMNTRLCWRLVWTDKVMEAVLSTTQIPLAEVQTHILKIIGQHARDVLGQFAGRCQSDRLVLDIVLQRAVPDLIPQIDPWLPEPPRQPQNIDEVKWFDASPLLDISLGAALVALREAIPEPNEQIAAELETENLEEILASGGRVGVERAFSSAIEAANLVQRQFRI
jgi:hypothetical protein